MIRTAKKFGYDGIEIDGKRPHGNPLDWPTARCRDLRSLADGEGIDIYAVAANNDFSNPVPEVREAQICLRPRAHPHDGRPRAPTTARVPGLVGRDPPSAARHLRHRRGLLADRPREVLDRGDLGLVPRGPGRVRRYAGDAGVTLALQNHKPLINDHHDVLRMVGEVDSPHLKVCLDAPLMPDQDAPASREAAHAVGPLQVLYPLRRRVRATCRRLDPRLRAQRRGRRRGHEPVLRGLRRAMGEIGYDGYISYELCHQLPVVDGQTVGIEFADQNAQLAAEFMREILRAC